jgi:hypothetical protein
VTGRWRKLHNEELHNLNASPNRWKWPREDRSCSTHAEKSNVYSVLVGKPEGKRPLGRPRRRLEDNIKVDLRDIGWGDMDWIEDGNEPLGSTRYCKILEYLNYWRLLKRDPTSWNWLVTEYIRS